MPPIDVLDPNPLDDSPLIEDQVIAVPSVDQDEAVTASELVDTISAKYGITDADVNVLYNAFVCVYLRAKLAEAEQRANTAPADRV